MLTLFRYILSGLIIAFLSGCQSPRTLTKTEHDPGYSTSATAITDNEEKLFDIQLFKFDSNKIFLAERIESQSSITSVIPRNKKSHTPIPTSGYAFFIRESGILEINFYSFSDSLITRIFSGYMDQGIYEILFDHVKIPAGSYLLKLKMKNEEISENIILPQSHSTGKNNPLERK